MMTPSEKYNPVRTGYCFGASALLQILPGLVFLLATACNSGYTPKKRAYFRIPFPEREYRIFDKPGFPYSFEYPVYAGIERDSTFFDEEPENPYWINLDFPGLNGKIHVSYKDLRRNDFDKLINDAFKLTFKHTSKATAIRDSVILTPNGVEGIYFRVGGNAATSRQFFLTDSTRHFLRGALYFDATPNADSLQPVNAFLEADMIHLINTLRWKD